MNPFDKCPVCGGELARKLVEKLLRGGTDAAIVREWADVCLRCGERLYAEGAIRRFERIRAKLEEHETAAYVPIGRTYEVADGEA